MAEFFLELFSEEIPARMQASGAEHLKNRILTALAPLSPELSGVWSGPRRLAVAATIRAETEAADEEVRGPRANAPAAAIDGFLRKNAATRDDLVVEGDFYYLRRRRMPTRAADLLSTPDFTNTIATLPWPKSMRWGGSGDFTWVRPLRRIICLLDGAVIPIVLGPVTASNQSEGHRFMGPGAFTVASAAQWAAELGRRSVIVDAGKRRATVETGLHDAAAARGLTIAGDAGLLDEVSGLVEWPVALIGAIEPHHMALPPEVRELSMKVNQRYFSTRDAEGRPASFFAFVANIAANDGGAAIVAGNERVLRARLSDAEHFWNEDRRHPLDHYLPKLKGVTFHAKLGTQFDRAERIAALAREIAQTLGATPEAAAKAERAGLLCKADLVTGMVGEFPELQGVMGGYYAGDADVGAAIRTHYQPKGPSDDVPQGIVPCAVALADKIDTLREFFRVGEKPTGSGDPYALRRAALGVIRIVLENGLRLNLRGLAGDEVFDFLIDRLRVKLRGEGKRFDVLNAVLDASPDDDLTRLIARTEALGGFLETDDGANLLAAYRRAANILRIEDAKDGPHEGAVDASLLTEAAETTLAGSLDSVDRDARQKLAAEDFTGAMREFATLRIPVDAFFDQVIVNDEKPEIRRNRLRLLARLRDVMHRVADFSKLEG
ncbi:MAG TPA: glycine--tRNA ligase subunit beta [Acidiphilium sp.]